MNMFFAAVNAVSKSVQPCVPWEYKAMSPIAEEVRHNKDARQRWYKDKSTNHCFYTAIEGVIATQRVGKENPPKSIHGFTADYDIKIPAERIMEAIKSMDLKPCYFETSLGGNFRLVWLLETPLQIETSAFGRFVLQQSYDWLRLGLLPGLDRPAYEEASRLYCNGGIWEEIRGGEPIPTAKSQAFFVECGKQFRFQAGDDAAVPLDIVEKAIREKYPSFDWPGTFELETQGPSFWIADSVSTQSAIVKPGGMFTFAAHASKPFYSWTDLLGKEFTDAFQADAIAKATEDVWWDTKSFWRRVNGLYTPMDRTELGSYFKCTCRLSGKPGQSGISQIESAFEHIFNHQRVAGAAPFVLRRSGLVVFDGERRLNTYSGSPLQPSETPQQWGDSGGFPFVSRWLDQFFVPAEQLPYWLAGHKHYYLSALNYSPSPGQNFFLMGGTGIGKTLLNREVVGASVGGFVDASDFLVAGAQFNSHLMKRPHWTLDDDAPAGSAVAIMRVHMMFKKVAANQQFICNTKFQAASMVEWMGRIGCTTNLDFVSSRIVGPLDNSSLDKTNLFRCTSVSQIEFPDRLEIRQILDRELPCFLRWLIDWEPPPQVERDARYGYKSYQEPALLDKTYQSSPTASFKEVLVEFLASYFQQETEAPFWEGTVSMLLRNILTFQSNDLVLKAMKLDQTSRFLEQINREGGLKSEIIKGNHNSRIWRFYRF